MASLVDLVKIQEVLDTLRPYLQADGGDVELVHATTLLQTLTIVGTLHANYLSLLKCKSLCSLLQPEVSPHVANVVLVLEDK